ncbi:two-component system NarL family sensor kinase [Litoreibacter meonggei]|uniref:Two-component system NarL family sensor kinase n=1 Tax=Litoreibacter meonggei TaxID=1049199 RepID=A0A497VEC9_9RHOB|nr:cache domain-containing protein [Litoreibacter meonggei]RLJ41800.1 two-component system NarL family sensor kinase [Litoreibacter meonggei]
MFHLWTQIRARLAFNYRQKIFLLTTLPLVLAVAAISAVVTVQSRQLAAREIRELESQLIEAKRAELKNYLSLARTAIGSVYGNAAPDDEVAKIKVQQTLSAMIYGQDGFFFVYDYDGNNLVSPRQTFLIGKNWKGLSDLNGVPVVDTIIDTARSGGGYHAYDWAKPSTRETARMVVYVIGLQDWKWALGTGIFIDDVLSTVAAAEAEVQARIQKTFIYIVLITILALFGVFVAGLLLNLRERRLADTKLRALTERIIDTQEEERGRVARELHDSISQILIGIRYTLELARKRVMGGDPRASESLDKGIGGLTEAIHEVRRISADLRPGVLDDLGLGPALKSLIDEFARRTSIKTEFKTVVFRNRLDKDAKIALYRIAQEALTNVERHAEANHVSIEVFGHRSGATMRITDNGTGISDRSARDGVGGLGLRNMQERIDQLKGTLRVLSSENGTIIEASVPLSHMLSPETMSESPAPKPRKTA